MNFPSAKEVKVTSLESSLFGTLLERIGGSIESAAEEGKTSANHYLDGNEQLYYEQLADFLIEKGYEVEWNGATLWMEISWENA